MGSTAHTGDSKERIFESTLVITTHKPRKKPREVSPPTRKSTSKKPTGTPTPLGLTDRRQKRREYEKIRNQRPERQQSARDHQKNYDKRPKSSAYAMRAPSRPSRARPGARRAQQDTGSTTITPPPNGEPRGPQRNRLSPAHRCHRVATKIRACSRSVRTLPANGVSGRRPPTLLTRAKESLNRSDQTTDPVPQLTPRW